MAIRFTKREYQVLARLGKDDADIANELNIGLGTVRTYNARIFAKLGARTRTAAVLKAIRMDIVSVYHFII